MSGIGLPTAIHTFLVARIENRMIGDREPGPVIDALPSEMPTGRVLRLASDGPFGWLMDARLDEVDGRLSLEVLEDDRMSGPSHYRVWEDGTHEQLGSVRTFMVVPADSSPGDAQQIEDDYQAHNRAVQEELEQRGFRSGSGDDAL
jgi:hypothetical protein